MLPTLVPPDDRRFRSYHWRYSHEAMQWELWAEDVNDLFRERKVQTLTKEFVRDVDPGVFRFVLDEIFRRLRRLSS